MKRLLAVLLLSFLCSLAWGQEVCFPEATCTSSAPCDFNLAASWTDASCGVGAIPGPLDIADMIAGRVVVYNDDALVVGGLIIDGGTFYFDRSATGRDGNGYRTLLLDADGFAGQDEIVFYSGSLVLGASDRIGCDSTGASECKINITGSGLLDAQGAVHETTIAALSDVDADTECTAAGTVGRKYVITPASGIELARDKRRIKFLSGKARGLNYEITAATATTFNVCTDMTDTESTTNGGNHRFTPHSTMQSAGVLPVSEHSIPARYGNSECTALNAPYSCCTGAGTGNCLGQIPEVGDRIAIIDDAVIYRSAGTAKIVISGLNGATGLTNPPRLRAFHLADGMISWSGATAGQSGTDLEYLNIHDGGSATQAGQSLFVKGLSNFAIRHAVVHDVTTVVGGTDGGIVVDSAASWGDTAITNIVIEDNTVYRIPGNTINCNAGPATQHISDCHIRNNLNFEGCTTDTGECSGIEMGACDNCSATGNVVHTYCPGDDIGDRTIGLFGAGAAGPITNGIIANNWIVNTCNDAIAVGLSTDAVYNETAAVNNYISNIKGAGIRSRARAYSNLIRNFGLASTSAQTDHRCLNNLLRAEGNVCILDDAVEASADCDGIGDDDCARYCGFFDHLENSGKRDIVFRDNVCIGLASSAGGGDRAAVFFGGSGAGNSFQANATVEHITFDNRGRSGEAVALLMDVDPAPDTTITINDILQTHANGDPVVLCTAQAGITDNVGQVNINESLTASEDGGAVSANCSNAGTLTRRNEVSFRSRFRTLDYNYREGAAELTAGTSPAGSPIGARAFRFSRDAITSIWPVLAFDGLAVEDIANVDNSDNDGDGVINLHDNCVEYPNPSQLDSNSDGRGDACL